MENGVRISDLTVDRGLRDALWLLRHRLRGRRIIEPACRKCGYYVSGLPEPRCPECGADLAKVGVIDPAKVRHWPIQVLWITLWTCIIITLSITLTERLLPVHRSSLGVVMMDARSDLPYTISINAGAGYYFAWPWTTKTQPLSFISLDIGPVRASGLTDRQHLSIRLPSESCTSTSWELDGLGLGAYSSKDRRDLGTFDGEETMLAWMEDAGFDTADPTTILEAQELCSIVRAARNTDSAGFVAAVGQIPIAQFNVFDLQRTTGTAYHRWRYPVATLVWIAIWSLGAAYIVFRRR